MAKRRPLIDGGRRLMAWADAACNRIYGWRFNPLYQTGTVAVLMFVILAATGVYLLLFYRIGDPYGSVERITDQWWAGQWIRGLHRYASAGLVVAVVLHAARMLLQDRHWGSRALAWISGLVLTFLCAVVAWTGYVMVWDGQALVLAQEGAQLLDALPIFAEPVQRMFTGESDVPPAFFFLILFLHIALPLGLALLLWIHVGRTARPKLLPPKKLSWAIVGVLLGVSILYPVTMGEPADVLRLTERIQLDVTYNWWLPVVSEVPPWLAWLGGGAFAALLVLVPYWLRPTEEEVPQPSQVDAHRCTGCWQCSLDCPWEAITMVERSDGRAAHLAVVDPSICARCGICAGSCAPMGVGPPEATGRDQLTDVRTFLAQVEPGPADVVVVGCLRGGGGLSAEEAQKELTRQGIHVYPVRCAGSVHTSVVEFLLKGGAGGVLVAACPPRDCWHREGTKWAAARLFHDREAELQARVDRRRVAMTAASAGEGREVRQAALELRDQVRDLMEPEEAEAAFDLIRECEREEVG